MKLLFTSIFLLSTIICLGQRQNVYFLKYNGQYVQNRDSADYTRIVREPDSASTLYNILEFYPNGAHKLIGKSSVIDPPKFEGQCISFYKNGKHEGIHNYKGGMLTGAQFEFYPNGKPYLVENYPDGAEAGHKQNDYTITAEYDSLGTAMVTEGDGYYKGFDGKFSTVVDEGNLKAGKRDGLWKGKDAVLNVTYEETYDIGNLISGISIGEKGDTVHYAKARGVEPQYKGGLVAFYKYIGENVVYPDYERANNIQGKVILSFIVEKDGKVSNIKVLNSVSTNIDNEAVRVLKASRNWIAGTEYGRNVRVYYSIPLNFALSN